jgi:hypothetical protein
LFLLILKLGRATFRETASHLGSDKNLLLVNFLFPLLVFVKEAGDQMGRRLLDENRLADKHLVDKHLADKHLADKHLVDKYLAKNYFA